MNPLPAFVGGKARRVIGPVPPRDKNGRMAIAPAIGKRVKLNVIGEPYRDANGQPVEEDADLRSPIEYTVYEQGAKALPDALKGLDLYQVDLHGEPLVQVYAKNPEHAVKVYKAEMGITRCAEHDPVATKVS